VTAYAEALAGLHRLEAFGIRLGLENVRAYCAAAGHPESACPVLHVAGTNGKGTTAACLAALGTRHGLRTGLYTSPHIVDLRERIRVDGLPVDADGVAAGWERVRDFVTEREMTFFEATTLIALERFAVERVDLTVLEVGLGGRLDATNVVTPEAAIVTNVGHDHERHLGCDLASIAREKAGIFKPSVPALVGEPGPPEVRAALCEVAARVGAPIRFRPEEAVCTVRRVEPLETRFDYVSRGFRAADLVLPMAGAHFAADAALALWAWETSGLGPVDPAAVRAALEGAAPAGRGEWHVVDGVPILFDVAHNPPAVRCLAATLKTMGIGPSPLVIGILADKDWPAMLDALEGVAVRAWLCGLETVGPERRLEEGHAMRQLAARPWIRWAGTVAEGLVEARRSIDRDEAGQIVVTGSFHTVGEALVALDLAASGEPYTRAPTPVPALTAR
jgi:dihydrofolate synthase/folylpolyglutamate synthase